MNAKSQKNLKIFSRILSIAAKVLKIFVCIGAIAVIICMLFVPSIINKIDVKEKTILYENNEVVNVDNDESISIGEEEIKVDDIKVYLEKVITIFEENSHNRIILFIEVIFIISLASLVIVFLQLHNFEKFFKNIYENETPFTVENANLIKKIAYFLAYGMFISLGGNILLGLILKTDFSFSLNLMTIMEILFLLILSYLFEYGSLLQNKSKQKIYSEEN